jgi:hypothetical protein
MGMPDMQSVEQTMNMSPMDLFDSIFWGESSPYDCSEYANRQQILLRLTDWIKQASITHNSRYTHNFNEVQALQTINNVKYSKLPMVPHVLLS